MARSREARLDRCPKATGTSGAYAVWSIATTSSISAFSAISSPRGDVPRCGFVVPPLPHPLPATASVPATDQPGPQNIDHHTSVIAADGDMCGMN
jgi:hypothetical protein